MKICISLFANSMYFPQVKLKLNFLQNQSGDLRVFRIAF